jgi:acyl dehydratase
MTTRIIRSYEDMREIVALDLGVSDWLRIEQAQVDRFGEAVEDTQWIHCDPERARRESPFGGTIVHGMLQLALLSKLRASIPTVQIRIPSRMGVFYGVDKVRFVSPVLVGAAVRLRLKIKEARLAEPSVIHVVYDQTLEIEGKDKPALVAETVNRIYVDDSASS